MDGPEQQKGATRGVRETTSTQRRVLWIMAYQWRNMGKWVKVVVGWLDGCRLQSRQSDSTTKSSTVDEEEVVVMVVGASLRTRILVYQNK